MKKIAHKPMVFMLFGLCWAVYFVSYLGRLNYSAAMAALLDSGVLEKTQAGLISTLFFVCYAAGQLINGFLGDRIPPKYMMLWGMGISVLMNLLMGFGVSPGLMALLWAVNGYAQSMIWPPIVYIFTDMFQKETMVRSFTNLSSTVAAGTLCSYFLSAMLIDHLGWQWAFTVPAGLMLLVGLGFFLLFPRVEKYRDAWGELEEPELPEAGEKSRGLSLKRIFLTPAMLLLMLPVFVHGILKDGLTAWVPTYLSESFGAGPVLAILASMVLPLVNLTGAYVAKALYRKLGDEVKASAVFFGVSCLAMAVIWLFGGHSLILSLVMLSVSSALILGINTLFISFVPIRYAKYGRSSSVSGFLNATAYGGAALSSVLIGILSGALGWNAVLLSFVIITAVAAVFCLLGKKEKAS